eukprot:4810999-Pleurochrysis_carterae.AAC.1
MQVYGAGEDVHSCVECSSEDEYDAPDYDEYATASRLRMRKWRAARMEGPPGFAQPDRSERPDSALPDRRPTAADSERPEHRSCYGAASIRERSGTWVELPPGFAPSMLGAY